MFNKKTKLSLGSVILAGIIFLFQLQTSDDISQQIVASSNGRIEANEIDISARYPGRIKNIHVQEGDMVTEGQTLVSMNTDELSARLDKALAELAQGEESVKEAKVLFDKAETDSAYAKQQFDRTQALFKKGAIPQANLDEKLNIYNASKSSILAAKARYRTLEKGVGAYQAGVKQIETELRESKLQAPVFGRILYQLAQKGEIVGAGGSVLTLLDLSKIYMEIFLPAKDAGLLQIGSEARVVLDIAPETPLPATVIFVSPQAQFTPKQVETKDERDKLVFRVKLQLSSELVSHYIDRVKTGLRGTGYVRIDTTQAWPDFLEGDLTQQNDDSQ